MSWRDLDGGNESVLRIAILGHDSDLSYPYSILTAALDHLGIRSQVLTFDLPRQEFAECVHKLESCGVRGIFVAQPLRVDAARIAERFWVAKYPLGVANVLFLDKGIFAQNTEVPAIIACLKNQPPTTALVMGTGHAARSVVAALLDVGFKVRLWNRNATKTRVLQKFLGRYGTVDLSPNPDPSGCQLVVNATPLGTKLGEEPPLMWARIRPRTVCFDLVFRRVPTDFLRSAAIRGLKTIDGREFLVEQCSFAIEWWTNKPAPRDAMKTAAGLKKGFSGEF